MSQLIIVFLIVLLAVLGVEVLQRILSPHLEVEAPKEEHRIHSWYQIEDGLGNDLGLICIECGKTPVQIRREGEVK